MKTAMDNNMLGVLFNMSKPQIRRAVSSIRQVLSNKFVPNHLGFKHITRDAVIRHKQHKTEDANSSRLITKIRWVVESVNARIKTWRYLARQLPNSQIPYVGEYVRIISALCNKYRPPLSSGDEENDLQTAAKMRHLSTQTNLLQTETLLRKS
uniref:DDE Tnp4 domain-containing protein n=1 Tax=Magallana gigas TaxID=29159 RepID=A0A8W8ILX5_MAGGI